MRSGSCSRQQRPPSEPPRSLQQAIATALPIVLALILLPAIAFASPPDPSWIAGFYDGADGDDIVSLVYETSAANVSVLSYFGPLPCLLELSLEGIVSHIPRHHFAGGPRSPPVLCSPEFAYVLTSLPPPPLIADAPVTLPSITTSRLSQHADLAALHAARELPRPVHQQSGVATMMCRDIDMQFWLAQAETEMRSLG